MFFSSSDHLNNYFSNIASNLDRDIPLSNISPLCFLGAPIENSFFCPPCDTEEICKKFFTEEIFKPLITTVFCGISIVLDSDRGHSYERFKKKINLRRKLNH